jgi:hypothetical protein
MTFLKIYFNLFVAPSTSISFKLVMISICFFPPLVLTAKLFREGYDVMAPFLYINEDDLTLILKGLTTLLQDE